MDQELQKGAPTLILSILQQYFSNFYFIHLAMSWKTKFHCCLPGEGCSSPQIVLESIFVLLLEVSSLCRNKCQVFLVSFINHFW